MGCNQLEFSRARQLVIARWVCNDVRIYILLRVRNFHQSINSFLKDGFIGHRSHGREFTNFCILHQIDNNRYIPFNGGPRICIGQQFALTEMAYTITRILQRYKAVENHMSGPAECRADIVLQPASPVLLNFVEADPKE
jgi:cytochrome P450